MGAPQSLASYPPWAKDSDRHEVWILQMSRPKRKKTGHLNSVANDRSCRKKLGLISVVLAGAILSGELSSDLSWSRHLFD